MTLKSRLSKLEMRASEALRREAGGEGFAERWWREVGEFLVAHVQEDLRAAAAARITDGSGRGQDTFASWVIHPFAPWAMPLAPDYVFPRAMVEWMLAEREFDWWLGTHCGRCGMAVPTWFATGRPVPDAPPFPRCPACGGPTSYGAYHGRVPEAAPEGDAREPR